MCLLVKYGLFLANLVFVLGGVALIGLGVASLLQLTDILELVPAELDSVPISIIVLGVIIFVIAFFGCCGAIRENRCLLSLYALCMIVLAIGKIVLAVIIFRNLDDIKESVNRWLQKAFDDSSLRVQFHALETAFSCCGTTGAGSYLGVQPALPPSCCAPELATCTSADAFDGCNGIVGTFVETYGQAIGIVTAAIVAIELTAMLLGLCFCGVVGRRRRRATV